MLDFIKKNKYPLILLLLTLIFFHKIILNPTHMIYPAQDIGIYSFWKHFIVNSTKQFEYLPLWNPYMFGGAPFLGRTESAMFYPLNLLFFFFPIELFFGYIFMIDIFLIGLFTYLFAKEIRLDKFSSILSAVLMMFGGTVITHILPAHIFILDGITWFPLLLFLYERGIKKRKIIYGALSGIPIAMMLVSGNPQVALYSLISALSFFIFRVGHELKRLLLIPLLSIFAGFSFAAIQLIPSLEFSYLSARNEGLSFEFASDFSLHPYQLIMSIFPHFFGSAFEKNTFWGINGSFDSSTIYMGILPLLLALIAVLFKKNIYTIFFLILGLFSILFAMGKFGFVFPAFFNYVPGFNLFRVPTRFLYIYGFSIAILAGIASNFFITKSFSVKEKTKLRKIILVFFSIVTVATFIFFYFLTHREQIINFISSKGYAIGNDLQSIYLLIIKDLLKFIVIALLSSALLFLATLKSAHRKFIMFLILLLTVLDLWFFDMQFYSTKNPNEVFEISAELQEIKKDERIFRIFDFDGSMLTLSGRNNIQTLTGFEAMYLKDYRDFLWLSGDHLNTPYESFFSFTNIKNVTILKLLNTKYVITKKTLDISSFERIYNGGSAVYRIKGTLPRAYLVPNAVTLKNKNDVIEALNNPTFDPRQTVILQTDTPHPTKNDSLFAPVEITKYEPDKIELHASLNSPGYLVLSEIWYPGWRAFDNGKEKEIYMANYILRSIYLDEGKHEITFIYDPKSYKIGRAITITSITFFALFLFIKNKHQPNKS